MEGEDPITLEPLNGLNTGEAIIINGQFFALKPLIEWTLKHTTNPLTNVPFSPSELQYIKDSYKCFQSYRQNVLKDKYFKSLNLRFPDKKRIQVFYRYLGPTRTVETVAEEDTSIFLRFIADREYLDNPNFLCLIYCGNNIQKGKQLQDYGIEDCSTVNVSGKFGYIPPWDGPPSF